MTRRLVALFFLLCAFAVAEPTHYGGWIFYEEEQSSPQVLIIESADEFAKFQARLPERKPSKRQPAPANEDPLRTVENFDFASSRLVVVARSRTISAYPQHVDTTEKKGKVVIRFSLPEPPPEARPFGWGVYEAIRLPQSNKSVVVEFI